MLFIGEKVGTGKGPKVDIALDPLEGTTLTAKAMANALAVIAIAEGGSLLHAPDTYMDKIAIGGGYPEGVVDLDADPRDNIKALAKAKGVPTREITACILDRPRHAGSDRQGARGGRAIQLISDGDIAGVIHAAIRRPASTSISAGRRAGRRARGGGAALRRRADPGAARVPQRRRAHARGAHRHHGLERANTTRCDLASGDVMFAATGVTDGSMLEGIHKVGDFMTSHTDRHALQDRAPCAGSRRAT